MKLSGKNIVLTGGTTGIGKEMVKRLHKDNQLLVMASNQTRLDALAAEYPNIKTHCVDLGSVADVDTAANAATSAFSEIDVLINNAAIQFTPTFTDDDFDVNSIEREVAINFTAICRLTARLLPALKSSKESAVLNVNSGLALAPKTTSAVYCASKAALENFSRSLRYQLEGTSVSVLQAFLPLVETPMTEGRGSGKMAASDAATAILSGLENGTTENYIGKSKLLAVLMRIVPSVARNIMKKS